MGLTNISSRHGNGHLRRHMSQGRQEGNFSQHAARDNPGAPRSIGPHQDPMICSLARHFIHQSENHTRVTGAANLEEEVTLRYDLSHFVFRHRNRPTGNVTDNVRLQPIHNLPSRNLTHTGSGHSSGVNLDLDAPLPGPTYVTLRLTVRQMAIIIKDKFNQADSRCFDGIKVCLFETWNQQ